MRQTVFILVFRRSISFFPKDANIPKAVRKCLFFGINRPCPSGVRLDVSRRGKSFPLLFGDPFHHSLATAGERTIAGRDRCGKESDFGIVARRHERPFGGSFLARTDRQFPP